MASSIPNLSGPVSDVVHMQQALYGFSSNTAQFNTYVSQATIDDSGFASSITSNFVNTSSAVFALQVLKNLHITPETLPAGGSGIGGSYALLLQALGQFFESYTLRERGQIVLNLTRLLTRLEDDATYGAIARSYNNETTLFHQQSTNTLPDYGDSAPAAPTKTVTYSATTFAEAVANDGSISTTSTITLVNDTFTGIDGQALTGAVVSNTPAGLTAVLNKTSATTAMLSFTGQATNHANANDIQNLTVTLGDAAFTGGAAVTVTGATKSDLVLDFRDPDPVVKAVTYGTTTFAEAAVANDGSISSTSTSTITLTDDTFTGTDGQALTGAVVTNTPAGLTAVLTKISATTATLSFTGQATNHDNADDIQNLTVTLGDAAFTSGTASTVAGATKSDLVVDFIDTFTATANQFGVFGQQGKIRSLSISHQYGSSSSGFQEINNPYDENFLSVSTYAQATAITPSVTFTVGSTIITQSVIAGTTGNDTITGTNNRDFIFGFAGNDTISGGSGNDIVIGGAGSDTITLGPGKDTLIFNSLDGVDLITDYLITDDQMQLSTAAEYSAEDIAAHNYDGHIVFAGTAGTTLNVSEFLSVTNAAALTGGSVAASTNVEKIIYFTETGGIYYNGDAATAGGLTLIGTLQNKPNLVASEFTFVG